ncbi:hypothetical protein AEP_03677 [Curvibacter sp. AEP1-3]|nr:hypothetical protein AEP_03677 [Curvibacter sp. AEP1-3]
MLLIDRRDFLFKECVSSVRKCSQSAVSKMAQCNVKVCKKVLSTTLLRKDSSGVCR